jgi:hypothetical protein
MTPSLLESILLPDGDRIAFEPEGVSRDLFSAMERLGSPDSFRARELTDAVLFFLSQTGERELPLEELNDLIEKVVRELGHPELASEFRTPPSKPQPKAKPRSEARDPFRQLLEAKAPSRVMNRLAVQTALQNYSNEFVYPRDLLSAAEQGLIVLTDRAAPLEMTATTVHLKNGSTLFDLIREAQEVASDRVTLFGIESLDLPPEQTARELALLSEWGEIALEVHLNHHEQPDPATGLFADASPVESPRERSRDWLRAFISHQPRLIHWHLQPDEPDDELTSLLLANPGIEIHLPAPRQEGVPLSVLTSVGMNLLILWRQLGEPTDLELYLKKLGSLARLAKSVGFIRRKFLRKQAREATLRGFRLERAVLQVFLLGLEEVTDAFAGAVVGSPSKRVELQMKLLQTIRQALESDRPGSLETHLETNQQFDREPMTLPQQIRLGSQLQHATGNRGCLTLRTEETAWHPETIREACERARDASLQRFRLH